MVACSRAASMAVLKKRARKMTQQHKDKTVSGNHGKAKTLITWLVKEKETRALTTSTDSEYKIKVSTRHYWFNWGKLPVLAEGLTCFCESRGRKNAAGILIPESHSTLGKYRSAVSHFRAKILSARCERTSRSFDEDDGVVSHGQCGAMAMGSL